MRHFDIFRPLKRALMFFWGRDPRAYALGLQQNQSGDNSAHAGFCRPLKRAEERMNNPCSGSGVLRTYPGYYLSRLRREITLSKSVNLTISHFVVPHGCGDGALV